MKKFLSDIILFIPFCILTIFTLSKVLPLEPTVADEVFESIEYSKSEYEGVEVVVIGDSVAIQLFGSGNKGSYVSLACNQAIDMIGHYLLLNNYLERNPQTREVIFVYNPISFVNDLDHKHTYNYFLKPFNKAPYKSQFTEHTKEQIQKIPHHWLTNFSLFRNITYSPEVERPETDSYVSKTTEEYYLKIIALCKERKINFFMVSPPLKEDKTEIVAQRKKAIEQSSIYEQNFEYYFDHIIYMPENKFHDTMHFYPEFIGEAYEYFVTSHEHLKELFQQ